MPILKPVYAAQSADFASGLSALGNNAVATSAAVDNSSVLMQDYLVEVYVAGTQATNAFLEVRLGCSEDNSLFGTWESAIPLGIIDFSVSPQRAFFSLVGHGGLYQAPKYFQILVKNYTGNALTGGTLKHQGIQVQSV